MADNSKPEFVSTSETLTEIEGEWGYRYTVVIYRMGKAFYRGKSHARYRSQKDLDLEDIYESTLIPTAQPHPIFPKHFTQSPELFLSIII
ncbi:hypothetical protein GJ744_012378 [Endocarpon pusillum]|uniref:Uncharacterized protein n=1 Tax=Endocarpon pusillum TaxID=364733 RepID=A0A8H7AF14_9EURO|nr:hypothetical protein GJ744_012378 [Endocarpon pusillum]